MKALVDADNVAFACAASAEEDDVDIAISRTNSFLERLCYDVGADAYELWLSGKNNFRYNIYPEYKANRIDTYRPKWEKEVKEFLVKEWNANVSDGCEADDMIGVRYNELDDACMCHLDKDINQIAGLHYNWELVRKGEIVREKRKYFVSPEEADRFFFYQLLIGDSTDNIKGASGIGPKKAEALLGRVPKSGWYEAVRDLFSCEEELELNAGCIYIWRKPNDHWRNLIEAIQREGQREELSEDGA